MGGDLGAEEGKWDRIWVIDKLDTLYLGNLRRKEGLHVPFH